MTGEEPITWTFLAPSLPRPAGGLIALYQLANATAGEGRDRVRIVHVPTAGPRVRSLGDVPWMAFHPAVEHQFASGLDPDLLPDADVVVYTVLLLSTALAPGSDPDGVRLIDALQGGEGRSWLAMLFLQGHGVFQPVIEELSTRLPGPKICVGSWLAHLLVQSGVPESDVVHIPNGVDPGTFRIVRAIDERGPRVAMNFNPYVVKGSAAGIAAIEQLHRRLAVPATLFGSTPLERALEPGLDFMLSPSQDILAEQVYNRSSMFLQASQREGFGMCAVEAMACGCALVTTSNGGSDDYAFDGETAIVCGGDAEQMAEGMERLVRDEELRNRLATNGANFVERFRWSDSAARLSRAASDRLAEHRDSPVTRVDLDDVVRQLAR